MKTSSIYAALLSGVMAVSCVGGAAFAEEGTTLISAAAGINASSKLSAPKNIKVTETAETAVTLKWDKVKGADGYKVYIYNTEKKKYALYKTVNGTTCKVEGLKSGKTYIFAVAATAKKGGKTVTQERSKGVQVTTAKKKKVTRYTLKKYTLKNKTVKVLATKDLFPEDGETAKLFKKTYGGEIRWYPTVEGFAYGDLQTYVLGGQSIDLFQYNSTLLSKGIKDGMYQPVDSYIDLNDGLWKSVSAGVEAGKSGGKHYVLATGGSTKEDLSGFMLVSNSENPDGAARLAECELYLANTAPAGKKMNSGDKQSGNAVIDRLTADFGWFLI